MGASVATGRSRRSYPRGVAATSPEILVDQDRGLRGTTSREYIAALTGLRGFAALAVLVGHIAGISNYPWIGFPSYGPIALFVLSGYLLFQPWSKWYLGLGSRPVIREFARRRAWRILPPYLVLLGVVWLVLPSSRPSGVAAYIRALTLTQIYAPGESYHGLGHVWSLGTELSWYVILPVVGLLVGFALKRTGVSSNVGVLALVVLMLALTIVWRLNLHQTDDVAVRLTHPQLFPAFAVCFFGGGLVGHLRVQQAKGLGWNRLMSLLSRRAPLVLMLALSFGVLGASTYGGPWGFEASTFTQHSLRAACMTAMALLLLTGVATSPPGGLFSRIFGNRPAVAVGRWSYGVYLWHFPVVVLLAQEFGRPRGVQEFVTWIAVVAMISTALGAATYAFVERPAIEFSRRRRS